MYREHSGEELQTKHNIRKHNEKSHGALTVVESLWIYYTKLFLKIHLKVLVDSFKNLFLLVSVTVFFKKDFSVCMLYLLLLEVLSVVF